MKPTIDQRPDFAVESASQRKTRTGRTSLTTAVVSIIVVLGGLFSATPAQAWDRGGDGDPRSCANAYVVASRPIVGTRGPTANKVIGSLELRWSSACHANWSRVVLYGKMYTSPVTVHQEVSAEGRNATAEDYNIRTWDAGALAWTRYLRLGNSQSTACVTASVSSDFGTLNFHTVGTSFCV